MANLSVSTEVNNNYNNNDETHITAGIQAAKTTEESDKTHRRQILYRVPAKLRENKKDIYDPVVLSLGPYHRNLQSEQFLQVEEFKNEILNNTLDPSAKESFNSKILERVDEIRTFYGGLSINEYKDEALAEMMLRDACFLLYYMELEVGENEKESHLEGRLGFSTAVFLYRDYFMLENQIPLWVIKLLITSKFDDKDEGEAFLCKYLSFMCFGDVEVVTKLPWEGKDQEPLHLLGALHRTLIVKMDTGRDGKIFKLIKWRQKRSAYSTQHSTTLEMENSLFRSVMDLKAKGIHFGPSSYCLTDIRFSSYAFYGKLFLPIRFVTNNTGVYFANMIAFEMSPETNTDGSILAYINFMKSLLESPQDVKELRENGILFSSLRNDEEVLKVFKEIDTYGLDNVGIFLDVKMRINKHCDSKTKTWMAELIHTYFRSPWTALALFSATFLLCLTFLQTQYTLNPRNRN